MNVVIQLCHLGLFTYTGISHLKVVVDVSDQTYFVHRKKTFGSRD